MNNDRKLIANELLPIYQTTDTGEKVVDGRELHEFLQAGRDFTTWLKDRVEKYGFNEGEDYSPVSGNIPEGRGKPRTDYILKLDMAKELAMVENNEQGRRARKYFIEVERRFLIGGAVPTVPMKDLASFPEHDSITKLLQMLRMGLREDLFTGATEQALRTQVAEMVLGHSIPGPMPAPVTVRSVRSDKPIGRIPYSREPFELPPGAPFQERWYLTAEIAQLAGVSVQLVASMSSTHNMRTPDKSRLAKTNPGKRSGLVQIMYNEAAKDELLKLLAAHSKRASKKR